MTRLKANSIPQKHRAKIRLFALLTLLFFTTVATGTFVGGFYIREAVKQERQQQAEIRAAGFAKALKSVLDLTEKVGVALSSSLSDTDGLAAYDDTVQAYLTAAPWTKAVILRQEDRTVVFPSDIEQTMRAVDVPAGASEGSRQIFGPYSLPNSQRVLIFRYAFADGTLDVAVGFEAILDAIGLMELEQTIQLSVQTATLAGSGGEATAGARILKTENPAQTKLNIGNSTWTVSVAPLALSEGSFDWRKAFGFALIVFAIAFSHRSARCCCCFGRAFATITISVAA
nr:hypothetical protein [Marinicella sp. W31]MDC2876607.1 hypothetical protein [Marinicella sp. W31]